MSDRLLTAREERQDVVVALEASLRSVQDLERALRGETWHGTVTGYTGHACRCDACRAAKATAWAGYAKRRGRIRRAAAIMKGSSD